MGRAAAGCRSELRTEVVTDSAAGEFSTDDGGLTEEGRCAAQARRWRMGKETVKTKPMRM